MLRRVHLRHPCYGRDPFKGRCRSFARRQQAPLRCQGTMASSAPHPSLAPSLAGPLSQRCCWSRSEEAWSNWLPDPLGSATKVSIAITWAGGLGERVAALCRGTLRWGSLPAWGMDSSHADPPEVTTRGQRACCQGRFDRDAPIIGRDASALRCLSLCPRAAGQ